MVCQTYRRLRQAPLRLDDARAALSGALSVAPDYVLLPLLLGRVAALEGAHEEARRHLEHALHLNPFDIQVHGLLAGVYEASGEPELAARERQAQVTVIRATQQTGDRP